ncbi:MAG TPA: hypothetical protein VFH45_11190, partial [Acidimicrobiales bacterium]|nr:hypothetical protein [Acidimicrobiales bacterium]
KAAQDAVVESVRNFSATVERVLPEQPRQVLNARLPERRQAVDRAFDFAGQVLEAQRSFADRLFDAALPAAPAKGTAATKAKAA